MRPPATTDPERLAALAFAGSELVIETDGAGVIAFAAGAFRNIFAADADTFVGRPIEELLAPTEQEALQAALTLLVERGRLFPFTVRLADGARTPLALAGIALRATGGPHRLFLSLARLPVATSRAGQPGSRRGLARAASARLRAGVACEVSLLEVLAADGLPLGASEAIGTALEVAAAEGVAAELAPGRFGVLTHGAPDEAHDLALALEAELARLGLQSNVTAYGMGLCAETLTPVQATRALRQALDVFGRAGASGLAEAGFNGGLAGYLQRVRARTGEVRLAIRNRRFALMYQPIVRLSDRVVHHAEALIRPHAAENSAVATPQEFVSLVEGLGLADELDLAVAQAVSQAAARSPWPLAFNLSGQSVQSAGCRDRLLTLLTASPACRAGMLLAEVTETAEIEDMAEAARSVAELRAQGVSVCLDDFGAGTTDVRLLRALSPDVVKLDGSYVPGIAQDGRERAIVAGMAEIARGAGAELVAERVETEAEATALADLGVQYGQGWLFGRPAALPTPVPARRAVRRAGKKESWE